jgi:single-strand DNA-binding protein
MTTSINRVILVGNLTRDPVLKTVGKDNQVASLTLALNHRRRDPQGEQHDEASFIDCDAWGKTAEHIGQYLTKGSPCLVEGHLKQDRWTDERGQPHSRIKVVVERCHFLPDGRHREGSADRANRTDRGAADTDDQDRDREPEPAVSATRNRQQPSRTMKEPVLPYLPANDDSLLF